jgi:hypothetical protein
MLLPDGRNWQLISPHLMNSGTTPEIRSINRMTNANGAARFKKCKQFFDYQHLLLLRDIWWSKF